MKRSKRITIFMPQQWSWLQGEAWLHERFSGRQIKYNGFWNTDEPWIVAVAL